MGQHKTEQRAKDIQCPEVAEKAIGKEAGTEHENGYHAEQNNAYIRSPEAVVDSAQRCWELTVRGQVIAEPRDTQQAGVGCGQKDRSRQYRHQRR